MAPVLVNAMEFRNIVYRNILASDHHCLRNLH